MKGALPEEIETDLPDLTDHRIGDDLGPDGDRAMRRILEQVQVPRVNIGTGPPGRAD